MAGELSFSESDYITQIEKLLPQGPAWEDDNGSYIKALLEIVALEFARIDRDVSQLIKESDPRYASKTLSDWFYEWGIPDECLKLMTNATADQYRAVLLIKIKSLGASFDELVKIIADYCGIESSLQKYDAFTVGSTVDQRVYSEEWETSVNVISANGNNPQFFTTTSAVDTPLAWWSNTLFECMVKSLAPCTENIIFQYN